MFSARLPQRKESWSFPCSRDGRKTAELTTVPPPCHVLWHSSRGGLRTAPVRKGLFWFPGKVLHHFSLKLSCRRFGYHKKKLQTKGCLLKWFIGSSLEEPWVNGECSVGSEKTHLVWEGTPAGRPGQVRTALPDGARPPCGRAGGEWDNDFLSLSSLAMKFVKAGFLIHRVTISIASDFPDSKFFI